MIHTVLVYPRLRRSGLVNPEHSEPRNCLLLCIRGSCLILVGFVFARGWRSLLWLGNWLRGRFCLLFEVWLDGLCWAVLGYVEEGKLWMGW